MSRTEENTELSIQMGYEHTKNQLEAWGVKFHKLLLGKPRYDIFIDDKVAFFKLDPFEIEHEIELYRLVKYSYKIL